MSIKLVCGEPGAGKSLYTMREIINLIRTTTLPIVTNLPVRVDPWMKGKETQMGLRAYLDSTYGETFDIDKRLRFISDDECQEFYTHRGSGVDLMVTKRASPTKDCPEGKPQEFDIEAAAVGGGVIYVVDEAWKFFGARDWQTHGEALLFYAKQHRKPGDEVFICTHDPKDLDTGIRRVAETTVMMRNHARMRIGMFRQPGYFSAEHYARVPSGVQSPMHTERFQLDAKGIAQTYDTSAGVGLKGGLAADTTKKKSGLHFGYLIAIVVVIALGMTRLPWLMGKMVGSATLAGSASAMKGKQTAGQQTTNELKPTIQPQPLGLPGAPLVPTGSNSTIAQGRVSPHVVTFEKPLAPLEEPEKVFLNGFLYNPRTKATSVMLSDGSRYDMTDPEVRILTKEFVVIQGKVYYWKKPVADILEKGEKGYSQVMQHNSSARQPNTLANSSIRRTPVLSQSSPSGF